MEPEKKSNGALVGSIIIIIILIIGGIYIWQSKVKSALEEKTKLELVAPEDTNELDTLEQELKNIDADIDVDLNSIN